MKRKQKGDFSRCNTQTDRDILSMEGRKKPTKLKFPFRNDIVFKMVFSKNPVLLKRLTANLLGITVDSITEFKITNPEIVPEMVKDKFCRLDINMIVNGRQVDLEIQVNNEGDYPERSLYYWAGLYHSSLKEAQKYETLSPTVHISIIAFPLFACKELQLWLSLFNAKTEEDLAKIEATEVPVMREAVGAYRQVTASDELFREIARVRERSRHNEASALSHAEQKEREKWQAVVAKKDALIAKLKARLGET
ncbi:MAG: Rpn family recombination-promoting nuclease/putative transposase [Spirochaetaceae bacterium]|nr:Rpn family recombination-promoting nuclease/putative transposase [Spirochaetaceae bacterium]